MPAAEERKSLREILEGLPAGYQKFEFATKRTVIGAERAKFPETFISTKTKCDFLVFGNPLRSKHWYQVLTSKDSGHGVLLKIEGPMQALENLGLAQAKAVHDAVCSIADAGGRIMPARMIQGVMEQNRNVKMTKKKLDRLKEAMGFLGTVDIVIVADDASSEWQRAIADIQNPICIKPERHRFNLPQPYYKGRLLPFEEIGMDSDVIYRLQGMPVLLRYAKVKRQLTSTPIELLAVKKTNRTAGTTALKAFLAREVDTMRKCVGYSRILKFKRLYRIYGLPEDADKTQTRRSREKILRVLDELKESGLIADYDMLRSKERGHEIKGIEIKFE